MIHLTEGLLWYFAFIFSTVIHEASHSLVALKLGDKTAYHAGQVSLDPTPHIKREPIGTIVVPIISFLMSGWMIGWASAPYDPHWARRYPERSAWMALAGPASNLVLVILSIMIIRLGVTFEIFYPPQSITFSHVTSAVGGGIFAGAASFVSIFFSLNLILFAFNLIPLPPLDGSGAIPLLLSKENGLRYMEFIHNSPFVFLGLFIAWQAFGSIFDPIHTFFINLLYDNVSYH